MQPNQYSSAGAAGAGYAIPTAPGTKPTIRTNAEKDPFLLLKGDHDSFRALMDALPSASPEQKRVICLELSREIVAHASIEEQWLHQLYKEHLGAEGAKFFDDSLVADQRNLNALSVLERESKGGLSELSGEAQEAFKQLTDTEFEHMRLEEDVGVLTGKLEWPKHCRDEGTSGRVMVTTLPCPYPQTSVPMAFRCTFRSFARP
jgi:hypothetical protein